MKNLLLLLASLAICGEALGFSSYFFAPTIYSPASLLEARIKEAGPQAFEEYKENNYSPVTGWSLRKSHTSKALNCNDEEFTMTQGPLGARIYDGYQPGEAEIILLGDSYTYGYETSDEDSIAANLHRMTGRQVANLGIGAAGPVQAFLRGKDEIENYPKAKTVVLGIMFENVYRMVNSYRPVYQPESSFIFGLKPFMDGDEIVPLDTRAFEDFASFKKHAGAAMRTDFWARPGHEFPYSMSFARSLLTNYMEIDLREFAGKLFAEKFTYVYSAEAFTTGLLSLLQVFGEWGRDHSLKMFVVFIPQDTHKDTHTPAKWIEENKNKIPSEISLYNFDLENIDKKKYNLRPHDCHLSEYGNAKVAAFYKNILDIN